MLFALGDDVGFKLKDGRKVWCPRRACLLRDDDGKVWPSCSLLIARIDGRGRDATDDEMSGAPKWWLGRDYDARVSMFNTPPRALTSWKLVGEVDQIFYDRFGNKAPGRFHHTFNKARGLWHIVAWIKGKKIVKLFKRDGMYRLELSGGCVVRDLGLIWP